ncbi:MULTISPECIES: PPC domain-containing protein [Moorena]|uniref:Bacterial pre-peptidase n=1 Tax=Moorena producens 3L TaxID=489825 RepID=F4XLL8_9CYAN|nr:MULTISPECIES: PPC domain-containing protein [Moorena]EGJ34493.1 bacterial pre-peptidase [Moorena producens 3L]NEP69432.1 hypothetical protein [Moorena sp. SIO3A5]NEQ10096.1 hypothetical protein [Moorena sp. SIO4E2]
MGTFNLGTLSGLETNSFTSSNSLTVFDPTDVFTFSLNGTKDIGIALTNISAGDDADLRLFRDSNDNGVFDSPDQQIASSINSGNSDDIINLADQGNGLYFAQVERYAPGSSGSVSYNLSLSATVNLGTLTNTPVTRNNFSVSADDPKDVFEFRLNGTSNIYIALTDISAGDDADLRVFRDSNDNGVFDSADQEIASSRIGGNSDDIINLADQGSGLYFAQVERFAPGSSGSVSYNLSLSNTFNLGTLTNTPVTRNNLFLTPDDPKDVFEFRLNGTSNINIALTDISAEDDADLRVFRDSNDNGIFDSADQEIASSRIGGNSDDSINLADQVTGLYFAEVERYAPGSSGSVSYDIALSTSDRSNILHTEQDFGDLSADRSLSGFVGDTDTTDTYEFSIGLFEGVNINLTGLSSDADLQVIRDSNNNGLVDSGEVIDTSTRGGSLSESININSPGDYFVQVYQFSGDTSYTLTLDL